MAPEGAMQVPGGNWQIFAKMVEASNARILLNSSVASIELKESEDPEVKTPKYILKTVKPGGSASQAKPHKTAFDDVVIAAPYQFSDIKNANDLIEQPIDNIPYATLHVTLFATSFRFSPKFFKQEPGSETPVTVLTTLAEGEDGTEGAGRAGFYSISLVKTVTNPKTENKEYVYKIFSPEKVTPEFLSSLLGVAVPETFTGPAPATPPSNEEKVEENAAESDSVVIEPISWYHPALFHPYPIKHPRVTFQEPILRDGLYYTSGIDSFISTMETNALMGMNVARLIVDDYLAPPPPKEQQLEEQLVELVQEQAHDQSEDQSSAPAVEIADDLTPLSDISDSDADTNIAAADAPAPEATTAEAVKVDHEQYVLEEQQDAVPESYGQPLEESEEKPGRDSPPDEL